MRLRRILSVATLCICAQSAFAHHSRFVGSLSGADALPPNNSSATSHTVVTIDFDELKMEIDSDFSGLEGTITEVHIHGPTAEHFEGAAGVITQLPTLVDFPTGVAAGTYSHLFDLTEASTYNQAFLDANGPFVASAMNALFLALEEGKAYFDIHTTAYPDGEIRGFLVHVPGDFNDNQVVDTADYTIWRDTFGHIGEGLAADADNSNIIDDADYAVWRQNFGRTGFDSGAGRGAAHVPEPATLALVLLGISPFILRRPFLAPGNDSMRAPRDGALELR